MLPVLRQKLGRLVYLSRTDDAPGTPSVWHNFLSPLKIIPIFNGMVLLMVIEDIVQDTAYQATLFTSKGNLGQKVS
jgi:hypothetical protein